MTVLGVTRIYNLPISYKGSNLSCNQATWQLVYVALQLHDLGEQVWGLRELSRTSAQAYFRISLSVFYPSSIQGYRSSLPASGLHRHPNIPLYPLCLWCTGPPVARWRGSMLLHSRINWLGVQSKPGNPCCFGPVSSICSWCRVSTPRMCPIYLFTYGDSGPRNLPPAWQREHVTLRATLPGRVLRYVKPSQ